ncbi:MAG: hypothetical protein ACRCUY_10980 [Thermoguttaceae bacterium]
MFSPSVLALTHHVEKDRIITGGIAVSNDQNKQSDEIDANIFGAGNDFAETEEVVDPFAFVNSEEIKTDENDASVFPTFGTETSESKTNSVDSDQFSFGDASAFGGESLSSDDGTSNDDAFSAGFFGSSALGTSDLGDTENGASPSDLGTNTPVAVTDKKGTKKKQKREKKVKEKKPTDHVPLGANGILSLFMIVLAVFALIGYNVYIVITRPESGHAAIDQMSMLIYLGVTNVLGLVGITIPVIFYKKRQDKLTVFDTLLGVSAVVTIVASILLFFALYQYGFDFGSK